MKTKTQAQVKRQAKAEGEQEEKVPFKSGKIFSRASFSSVSKKAGKTGGAVWEEGLCFFSFSLPLLLYGGAAFALLRYLLLPGGTGLKPGAIGFYSFGEAFGQSLLSLAGSLFFGSFLALRLFFGSFSTRFRRAVILMMGLLATLPSLPIILALVKVWGNRGWINRFLLSLPFWPGDRGIPFLYHLSAVVGGHIYLNTPLVVLLLYQKLCNIPQEHWNLSRSLGFSSRALIRHTVLPSWNLSLRSLALLIFLYCFRSFPLVLILGGGKVQTPELGIFRALQNADISRAVMLSFLQFFVSFIVFWGLGRGALSGETTGVFSSALNPEKYGREGLLKLFRGEKTLTGLLLLFFLLPLAALALGGLSPRIFDLLREPVFWRASITGLGTAAASLVTALLMLWGLLRYENRESRAAVRCSAEAAAGTLLPRGVFRFSLLSGFLPLLFSPFILMTGWFLLLHSLVNFYEKSFFPVILANSLMILPVLLALLLAPVRSMRERYEPLARLLGLKGFSFFCRVFWPSLRPYLLRASALAFIFAFGDFGIIAFLGTEKLITLPLLLYNYMGHYRMNDADVLGFLILVIYGTIFWMFERGNHAES